MTVGVSLAAADVRHPFRSGFTLDVPRIEVPAGTTLALLGPSGSGKSTLLAVLGLLQTPARGRVLLDGEEVSTRDRRARLAMAAVFQRPYLFKGTVAANVEYGLSLRKVAREKRAQRVEMALERVGLAGFAARSVATLSGGEAQRVALARALVLEPRVLLLDEPLASLDPLLSRRLAADFATILRQDGVTVVWVTHDHDEARAVADDVAVMNAGQVVAHGPSADVMTLPADEWTAEFLGMEPPGHGVVTEAGEGLVHIACGAATEIVAAASYEPGTRVIFAVPPEDVLLATADARVGPLSARNRLRGTVVRIEPRGATWRVVAKVGETSLASMVSRAALDEMGLRVGEAAQVVFKATAVRVAAE